jgi:hypothetical protein
MRKNTPNEISLVAHLSHDRQGDEHILYSTRCIHIQKHTESKILLFHS